MSATYDLKCCVIAVGKKNKGSFQSVISTGSMSGWGNAEENRKLVWVSYSLWSNVEKNNIVVNHPDTERSRSVGYL